METMLASIVLLAAVFSSSTIAYAAGPRILIEHKLTGFKKADSSATLDYSLHLTNPGSTPVSDLPVSLVPRSSFMHKKLALDIGHLGRPQDVTLLVQVVTVPGDLVYVSCGTTSARSMSGSS